MRAQGVRETETCVSRLSLRFFPSSKGTSLVVQTRLTASSKPLPSVDKRDLVECNCACK